MSSLSVSDLAKIQTVKRLENNLYVRERCSDHSPQVKWTWFKPWDSTRVTFAISRYLPFAGVGMTAYGDFYDKLIACAKCASTLEGISIVLIPAIGIAAAESLLVLRTWAFWQKSKRLMIGLRTYSVLTIVAVIVTCLSPKMLIPGEEPPLGTCYFESTRNYAVPYMFLAMFESLMLALTVYKRVHDYRGFQSGIVVTLYHDGIFYMMCILTITLANVIVVAALPSAYSNLFATLQPVTHSVLASRILFRIRHSNEREYETSSMTLLDPVNFLRPPAMSIGGTTRSAV
ncbi:hypothetical protein DEU56DRAFT_808405 [Suillus clintonianus]|uniref:uncharacterized protein n=1 Tax=Suillus clintonianus TaxID=1904413 RepID=UPI001B87F09F|nr:uncharacterized protein DEU56DRAFT_808405 [Suillus clintonianus]KAG2135176.1 hypothetical protein DEU56DRAFT_808405 [Suillus clintonianus]